MTPDNHRANQALVRGLLVDAPGFIEVSDPLYGILFQCQFTPCCVPLATLAWVNPDNEGIFVRVIVPSLGVQPSLEVLAALNEINATLPIGAFIFAESGEVRFKSAIFVGDTVVPKELLGHLFASAGDMVRAQFPRISRILTGAAHTH